MAANLQRTTVMECLLAQPGDHRAVTLPDSPHVGLPQPVPSLLLEGCLSLRPCPTPVSLIRVPFQRSPSSLVNPPVPGPAGHRLFLI